MRQRRDISASAEKVLKLKAQNIIGAFAGVVLSVASLFSFCGEASGGAPIPPATRGYQPLRYEEDYRFLRDPSRRSELWDRIKYIPIAEERGGYFSFGGEVRERFEAYENEFFRKLPNADNAFLLQRILVHGDYHLGDTFRIFGQVQGSMEDGRPGGPRPTDREGFDIHQLFGDVVFHLERMGQLTLRVGRQEFSYGSERLISAREGTNNRRSFDAVRLLFKRDDIRVDMFAASLVEDDDDSFDNQNARDVWFWGVYATLPVSLLPGTHLDAYYLGLDNPRAAFSQGAASEERHTLGMRWFGQTESFDFNTEAIYQFGHYGAGTIQAWSVATDQGYTFKKAWAKPRLGLKAAIASGDRDAADSDLQSFNPLFPRGNYFTEASTLGPSNFIAVRPRVTLHPAEPVGLDMGVDFFWRENRNDGIYNPGGAVIYRGNPRFSKWVGTDISVILTWQATRHLALAASYSHFFAGRFIEQNDGQDIDFCAVWATYKF